MRDRADLARGWLEKCLKAFLTHAGVKFPHTHNLSKLVALCVTVDDSFQDRAPLVASLTPYAVELRYDDEFWPARQVAEEAVASMLSVRDFVGARLPGWR